MKCVSTYSVKIKNYNKIFEKTVNLYRGAVDFYIPVINDNWDLLYFGIKSSKEAVSLSERLTVETKNRPDVKYNFSEEFYKFPSYLRRAAIREAYGLVCSYRSNLSNWEKKDKRTRGHQPSVPKAGFVCPGMYRDNCYVRTGTYTARIKVFIRNTWDWLDVEFRKSDVDYINRKCADREECIPTLQKRGKEWYLDFAFKKESRIRDISVTDRRILAVDLGINSSCTCVCMTADGTVLGRKFLKLSGEYDCLTRKINHIKRAQRHGSRKVGNLWKYADGVNDDIAVKTAEYIMDTAIKYNADVIIFENLNKNGKKSGTKKEMLHLWKAGRVQDIVTGKAHMAGIRISRVNAKNTSALAYDGSGKVKRGNKSKKAKESYSLCEFKNGKVYNCDLNAAYNIGARYYVREILKTLPVTEEQRITAKVPGCVKRSTCTLSTLISLNAELYAAA